jgi:hypothetical protein
MNNRDMATKTQAEDPKKKKQQSEAFRKAARELGCDESETAFDGALKKIARHKPTPVHEDGVPSGKSKQSGKDR